MRKQEIPYHYASIINTISLMDSKLEINNYPYKDLKEMDYTELEAIRDVLIKIHNQRIKNANI